MISWNDCLPGTSKKLEKALKRAAKNRLSGWVTGNVCEMYVKVGGNLCKITNNYICLRMYVTFYTISAKSRETMYASVCGRRKQSFLYRLAMYADVCV